MTIKNKIKADILKKQFLLCELCVSVVKYSFGFVLLLAAVFLGTAAAGEAEVYTFMSASRDKQTSYLAYIPASDEPDREFPVLFLLHGAWDSYTAWQDHADKLLREFSDQHQIAIVLPDGDPFGWYADSPRDPANRIETYFVEELIPHVKKNLPVNDRQSIAGLSMGGHGAMILAMRHPGTFVSASSMSGILDLARHPESWELPRVFGPYQGENRAVWQAHSALDLAQKNADYLRTLPLLVTVSTGDQAALPDNRLFHKTLESLNVPHQYRESPGGHDWDYWLEQLPGHLAFHAEHLNNRVK